MTGGRGRPPRRHAAPGACCRAPAWRGRRRSTPRSAQRGERPRVAADVLEPDRQGVDAVVVAAEPDVVDAGHLADVLDVRDDVVDRRPSGLGCAGVHVATKASNAAQSLASTPDLGGRLGRLDAPRRGRRGDELRHEGDHADPAVVGAARPARRRARCAGGRRRRGPRSGEKITGACGDVERVRASCRRDTWREVDEHAEPVHLAHHLAPNGASPPRTGSSVAESAHGDVVVVGERQVAHAEARAASAACRASSRSCGRPRRPSSEAIRPVRQARSTSARCVARASSVGIPRDHAGGRASTCSRVAVTAASPCSVARHEDRPELRRRRRPARSRGRSVCVVGHPAGEMSSRSKS